MTAAARGLGAGTTARFLLLLILIPVTTGLMTLQVATMLSSRHDGIGCALAAGVDPERSSSIATALAFLSERGAYLACMAREAPPPAWWLVAVWPLVVVVAGAGLFAVLPALKTRGGRAVPLTEAGDVLAELTRRAGLSRAPRFVLAPMAESGAVVFGRTGKPVVRVPGVLLARRHEEPDRFEAVLLHELAHIRNRDVTLTYLTVAFWRVFLALTVVPYLVVTVVWLDSWAGTGSGGGQVVLGERALLLVGVLVVLVTLVRADVLRSREVHADLAAVRWGASVAAWEAEAVRRDTRPGRLWDFVTGPWDTHPRWQVRHGSLGEPAALYRTPWLQLFLAGAGAMLVNAYLSAGIAQYGVLPFGQAGVWVHQAIALLTAGLVAGVTGPAIWRAVEHAVRTGRAGPSSLRFGSALGTGMVSAEIATHRFDMSSWLPARPEVLLLLLLGGLLLMWWMKQCAVLGVQMWPGRTLRPVVLIALVAAGLVLAWWFAWWVAGGGAVLADGWPFTADAIRGELGAELAGATASRPADVSATAVAVAVTHTFGVNLMQVPLAPAGLLALWSVPVLAWLVRPPGTVPEPWPPVQRVLGPALVAGAVCWAAAVAVRAATGAGVPAPAQGAGDQAMRYSAWLAVALLGAAAVAAVVACVRTRGYRLLVPLVAAGTTVLIGSVGVFVAFFADGCVKPPNSPWPVCHAESTSPWTTFGWLLSHFLAPVLILAAVAAVLVALCFHAFDRLVPRDVPVAVPPARHRVGVAVLCVVTVAVAAVQADQVARERARQTNFSAVQQAAQRLSGTVAGPPSPAIAALQVTAWRRRGGDELFQHVQAAGKQYDSVLRDLRNRATWTDIRTKLGPVCEDLGRLSQTAASYFRIPDREAQTSWQAMITRLARGSGNCRDLVARKDIGLMRDVHADFKAALGDCARAEKRAGTVQAAEPR